jgi:ADP-ribose pyrophosphatase
MQTDLLPSDLYEETLHSEPLVQGQFLQVYRDIAEVPGKGPAVREFVRHPGAAAIVPLFDDGTILLVRQFRYAPGQEFLEIPAGKFDGPGEDPASAARRELEEETGHVAAQLTPLGALNPCIGYSDEVIHFFLAEGLRATEMNLDETEQLVPVRISFEEACARARRGELADMKTMAALLMAEATLARRRSAC